MPDAPRLPPRLRRTVLESLSRDRLSALTEQLDVQVEDRRQTAAHVDALVRARRVDFGALLALLKREELQGACDALGIDRSGREKDVLAQRILALATAADEEPEPSSRPSPAPGFALDNQAPRKSRPSAPRATPTPRASRPGDAGAADYRHDATRKNNPPAGLIEFDRPPPQKTKKYTYDPHLDPQLHWSGKAERGSFEVDTVSLHIHERVSTQAILRAVQREDAQRDLFADVTLPDSKAIDFYAHDVGWANRLILGDSLVVMNSLLEREQLAGKVQCIYMDPPYGVKFNSNFQPSISKRDVKDGDDASLTREPEQIQAYRDTWELGIHSYLTYMRDRLLLARELLHESGSIFVQISEDNLHHARELLDEVFGSENFISMISFAKSSGTTSKFIPTTNDYILWFGRNAVTTKYRPLFLDKSSMGSGASAYTRVELPDGTRRTMSREEKLRPDSLPKGSRIYTLDNATSQSTGRSKGEGAACWFSIKIGRESFTPGDRATWKTNEDGMTRLLVGGRLEATTGSIRYVRFLDDFPAFPLANVWSDTSIAGFASEKQYVVETSTKVVERCLVMTTDPGDLVLDITCGSGTTAFVAEHFGRRWITCDTSRVALSLARQRLLTARFPYYRLRSHRVRDGFHYKTVPHITLKSIAQNPRLDACKTREERERVIRETAEQEVLYDQPLDDKERVRVAGPFTVEGIPAPAVDHDAEESAAAAPDAERVGRVADPGGDYVSRMIDLLRKSGVLFASGRHLPLPTLRAVKGAYEHFHAESETGLGDDPRRVAISLAPQHAPVTPVQVMQAIHETRGHDIVLFVGFGCDPEARRVIDQGIHGRELQYVQAASDILVGDLLKTHKTTRLFTAFGAPDVRVHREEKELVSVELTGVDLYDPITGTTEHGKGEDVAAWFVDHDYDGRTFCICQALFPGRSAKNPWEKLQKALKGTIDEERFEALRSTRSVPFKPGKKVAVRVIDDRGNEVVKIVDGRAR